MDPFTTDQIAFIQQRVARWIEHVPDGHHVTPADVTHSALLYRLLEGKEPFPHPPPLSYSYPDYGFAEGREEPVEVFIEPEPYPGEILVNQTRWVIEEKAADGTYLVSNGPWRGRLSPLDSPSPFLRWKLVKVG